MTHDLKILPEYFEQVITGNKSFEIRRNDRDFHIGDKLCLKEWENGSRGYTGRMTIRKISYITDYAQKENYVVLGMRL